MSKNIVFNQHHLDQSVNMTHIDRNAGRAIRQSNFIKNKL